MSGPSTRGSAATTPITTADGDDIVLGGAGGDIVATNGSTTTLPDVDLVVGDHAVIEWNSDADPADLDSIVSTDVEQGGADGIVTGIGNDVVVGGTAGDGIHTGAGNDIVLGDHVTLTFDGGVAAQR